MIKKTHTMLSIKDILTCKVCDKYLRDPVVLPCGKNICKEHVKLIKLEHNSSISTYNCQICNKKHQVVNTKGFGANETVNNLLKLRSHLDEDTKKANEAIDDLDKFIEDWKTLLDGPAKLIADYFGQAKAEIVSARNKWIQRAQKISQEMLNIVGGLEKGYGNYGG